MTNWAGDILDTIEKTIKEKNFKGLKICTVKSVKPLVLTHKGIDISSKENDILYVHPLFTGNAIELDEETLSENQNFKATTAYNSQEFTGIIEGTIPNFLKDFYLFYKEWQSNYLLKAGDIVIVFEGCENTYVILQKIIQDKQEEEN